MIYTLQFGTYTFPNQSFIVESFPLENDVQENQIARRDGAVIPFSYLKARSFRITGNVYQADQSTALTDVLAIQAALLANGESKFFYRSDRYINARMKTFNPVGEVGTDFAVLNCDITMEAADPYFYAAAGTITDVLTATGNTYNFNINGNGDVFSEPIVYVCATGGTITDNIQVKNTNTGSVFKYRGTVANGLTVSVDTTQLAVTYAGVDGLSYFQGDFLTVAAGSNAFQYVGSNARVTVEHKDRYYN